MERVRHYGGLESAILEVRSEVSELNARAYRLLNGIGGLDESRIRAERRAIADGFTRLGSSLEETAARDPDGLGRQAFDPVTPVGQLAGMIDGPLPPGPGPPRRGPAAMRSADARRRD